MNNVFDEKDYSSGDGMLTTVWGPMVWHFLHIISFNYPVNPTEVNKKHYMEYVKSLGNVLPCKYCRENYKKNLKIAGFNKGVFKDRDSFSKFVYNLHNTVNKMLKKDPKTTPSSYEEVRFTYEHFRARCVNDTPIIPKHIDKKENGCLIPLHGKKAKCVIHIVPKDSDQIGFKIHQKCRLKNLFKK